jgi:hypothetical protein
MSPISFSDSELDLLLVLAQPLAPSQRDDFLRAVAEVLAQHPERGDGLTHKIGVELQTRFRAAPPPDLRRIARSRRAEAE